MRTIYLIPAVLAAGLVLSGCGQETPAVLAPAAPAAPAPTLAELPQPYDEGDLAAGRRVFGNKCASCHSLDAAKGHLVGPNLHGLFERRPAAADGYGSYSKALAGLPGELWSAALLEQWLANPRTFLPGSNMFFNGLPEETDRRNVIAYLMIESRR